MDMKKRIKETGEVKELLPELNDIPCVLWKDKDNRYYNPEEVIDVIDWEQRRYELAKAAMQGIYSNSHPEITMNTSNETMVEWALMIADAMIEKLKGGN